MSPSFELSPECDPANIDSDGDGYSVAAGECQDSDPDIIPGALEILGDGVDNDCHGVIDNPQVDNDGDGYYAGPLACDDLDQTVHPGAVDEPDDTFTDTNCDLIEGDFARAIFVNLDNGSKSNTGGMNDPFVTITFAIGQLKNQPSKSQVLVSQGVLYRRV